ncbi:MAG TPA: type II toxin-antitoxin system HicB family antitoxin [Conexibacter sp.]|jgi:predicted RNase H-like HicB family nuclease
MKTAQLIYHDEPEGWWAASPDLPGYSAAGSSFDEVRALTREGAAWFAEEDLDLRHLVPGPKSWWSTPSVGQRARLELVAPTAEQRLEIHVTGFAKAA